MARLSRKKLVQRPASGKWDPATSFQKASPGLRQDDGLDDVRDLQFVAEKKRIICVCIIADIIFEKIPIYLSVHQSIDALIQGSYSSGLFVGLDVAALAGDVQAEAC